MRYDQAIMLARDDDDAGILVALSTLATLLVALLLLGLVSIWGGSFAKLLNTPTLVPWLWAVPLATVVLGLGQTFRVWLSRGRQYKEVSLARLGQSSVDAAGQVFGGVLSGGSASLLAAHLAGAATHTGVLLVASHRAFRLKEAVSNWRSLVQYAVRFHKFPLFLVPGGVIVGLGNQGFVLLVAIFFGPTTSGLFFLTHRVLALPTSVMAHSISTAFYERLSTIRREGGNEVRLIARVFLTLFMISIIPMGLVGVFGPLCCRTVFGAAWEGTGYFARAMFPNYLLMLCVTPLTQSFSAYERQECGLAWQTAFLVAATLALWLGNLVGGPMGAFAAYGLAGALMYALVLVLALRWAGCPVAKIPVVLVAETAVLLGPFVGRGEPAKQG